jgi:hypothetical protein
VHGAETTLFLVVLGTVVAAFAGRLRVPAPALLVVAGLVVGLLPRFPPVHVPPDVVSLIVLPPKVQALLQAESLFNDATSLVLFQIAMSIAVAGDSQYERARRRVVARRRAGPGTGRAPGSSGSPRRRADGPARPDGQRPRPAHRQGGRPDSPAPNPSALAPHAGARADHREPRPTPRPAPPGAAGRRGRDTRALVRSPAGSARLLHRGPARRSPGSALAGARDGDQLRGNSMKEPRLPPRSGSQQLRS